MHLAKHMAFCLSASDEGARCWLRLASLLANKSHLRTTLTDSDGLFRLEVIVTASVIHNPSFYWITGPLCCIAYKAWWRTTSNKSSSFPWRVRYDMVQGLVSLADVVRGETGRIGLHRRLPQRVTLCHMQQ
jgi:hypothetical protein